MSVPRYPINPSHPRPVVGLADSARTGPCRQPRVVNVGADPPTIDDESLNDLAKSV